MNSTSFPPTRPGCGRWRRDAAVAAAGRTVGTGAAAWAGLGGAAGRSVVLAGRLALRGAGRAGSTGVQDDPGDAGPADAAGTRCGGRPATPARWQLGGPGPRVGRHQRSGLAGRSAGRPVGEPRRGGAAGGTTGHGVVTGPYLPAAAAATLAFRVGAGRGQHLPCRARAMDT